MDLGELPKDPYPCHAELHGLLGHTPFALVLAILEAEAEPAHDLVAPAPESSQFGRDAILTKTLEASLGLLGLLKKRHGVGIGSILGMDGNPERGGNSGNGGNDGDRSRRREHGGCGVESDGPGGENRGHCGRKEQFGSDRDEG